MPGRLHIAYRREVEINIIERFTVEGELFMIGASGRSGIADSEGRSRISNPVQLLTSPTPSPSIPIAPLCPSRASLSSISLSLLRFTVPTGRPNAPLAPSDNSEPRTRYPSCRATREMSAGKVT